MYHLKHQVFIYGNKLSTYFIRKLTSTEISTALRPFYFTVHPDLFGQYPTEQATNESSLQQLSSLLANLQDSKPVRRTNLTFYIKDSTKSEVSFCLIKIHIRDRDIRSALITILKSSGLSTKYIESICPPSSPHKEEIIYKAKYKYDIDLTKVNEMERKMKEAQDVLKLTNWLRNNYKDASDKTQKGECYREEIKTLQKVITNELNLKEIRWDCGWNDTHFKGCLLSFKSLVEHHPEIRNVLKDRVLVFSFFTGVSLDGHIMLYCGEVRHNWLDLLKNVERYDKALTRIPAFEKSLSHVLRNIKVGRRKFMPKIIAGTYEQNLKQITTSLSDYVGRNFYPKEWPASLSDYEIVVETEAGPLMVSPTGQFIVPASMPGVHLVSFITNNLTEAKQKNSDYQRDKHLERDLMRKCLEEFQLAALLKEDNVTPDLMIKCCQKLLGNANALKQFAKGLRLNISTYYSVLTDGVVCIPWNFEL